MTSPSTQWQEQIAADEDARFEGYAQAFASAQAQRNGKHGAGVRCTASSWRP
jgi:hypothetical protein